MLNELSTLPPTHRYPATHVVESHGERGPMIGAGRRYFELTGVLGGNLRPLAGGRGPRSTPRPLRQNCRPFAMQSRVQRWNPDRFLEDLMDPVARQARQRALRAIRKMT
jgi:hypothetical protein